MIQRVQIDVAQQRTDHRALGRALFRNPFAGILQNTLFQERLDQCQNAALSDLAGHQGQQAVFRDRVEVAFQIGIAWLPGFGI